MPGRWVRNATRPLLRYYAALRLAAGSMLDIVPIETAVDVPPIVRRSTNELPSGFDRRELVVVRGRTHIVVLVPQTGRPTDHYNMN